MLFEIILLLSTLLALVLALVTGGPSLLYYFGSLYGSHIRSRQLPRKELILSRVAKERKQFEEQAEAQSILGDEWEKVERQKNGSANSDKTRNSEDKTWDGIIGFFHPFANAGGGGERVLWAAVRVTQQKWPNAICAIYTGDHEVSKEQILKRSEERFNIRLNAHSIVVLYLSTRHYVLSSTWPHFTLLGQSLGSLVLAHDAFTLLAPDIFVDTMGYAFALALSKFFFPNVPTAAYVHYPTISTDMLQSLDSEKGAGQGIHAGLGQGWRGTLKKKYWHLFAKLYSWAGSGIDVVMTNSSWTQSHIRTLWGPNRMKQKGAFPIDVVFPPTAVEELEREVDVSAASEKQREPVILYIAQFRPEKNHELVLRSFSEFVRNYAARDPRLAGKKKPQLVLIGSVRDSTDETQIYNLRLLTHELHLKESVTFLLNASWPTILTHLRTASVGVNAMWNEHFGIGVVEYQAAGLISVVNNSGGPKNDIVVDDGDGPTGYHASTAEQYAECFANALLLDEQDALAMRLRARRSSKRFSESSFDERWTAQIERVVGVKMKTQEKDGKKA